MVPATERALVNQALGVAQVVEGHPVAPLRLDHVLAKVYAVALNPTDWKALYTQQDTTGTVIGVDYAGVVEEVGEGPLRKNWKKGDRIAGMVHGGNAQNKSDGTFAEYTVGRTGLCVRLPDHMPFEKGATLIVGLVSVGLGFKQLELNLPDNPLSIPEPILIHGASTASGTLAVQEAKIAGYTVIATCSKRNFDLVKSRRADLVIDYNSPTAIDEIKKATNDQLRLVFDCHGEAKSPAFCYKAMGRSGGKYTSLLLPEKCPRDDIVTTMVNAYTAYGLAFNKFEKSFPALPEVYEFTSRHLDICEKLLAEEKLIPHPEEDRDGGLEAIPSGLVDLKEGRVSGVKLVYHITE